MMNNALVPSDVRAEQFEQFMRKYENAVLRTCFLYLSDRSLAEDAAQDTFMKVWRSIEKFEHRNTAQRKLGSCESQSIPQRITAAQPGFAMSIFQKPWRMCFQSYGR